MHTRRERTTPSPQISLDPHRTSLSSCRRRSFTLPMSHIPNWFCRIAGLSAIFVALLSPSPVQAVVSKPDETFISPDRHFALLSDLHTSTVTLIRLPSRMQVGEPLKDFAGLPGHGSAVWNLRARRVAVYQGGMPQGDTRVIEFSGHQAKELRLPDLQLLLRRWYPVATASFKTIRTYIQPVRWLGVNTLELSVNGSMWGTSDNSNSIVNDDVLDYDIRVHVRLDRTGAGRSVFVKESPP